MLCACRYGNVMASRGSVIPLFLEQIKAGKTVTITDPKMTRFLMHLDEAVELVMYAFENAKQGDIFIKKAPASTIQDLAASLIELMGNHTTTNVIGTRHGEKLFETLVTREEMVRAEDLGSYFRIPPDTRDLNYDKFFSRGDVEISEAYDYTSHNTKRLDTEEVKQLLLTLDCVKEAIC
jgi:UDP-glucose 4-epimerase